VDVVPLVLGASLSDSASKSAARAAAAQQTNQMAAQAAQNAVAGFSPTSIVPSMKLSKFQYDAASGQVYAAVTIQIHLPVPVPCLGINDCTLNASDTEAIAALL